MLNIKQRPRGLQQPAASSVVTTSFPTDQPEQKIEREGTGSGEALRQKRLDLIKEQQQAKKRGREGVKKLLKGHSKAAETVCGRVDGIRGRGHRHTSLTAEDLEPVCPESSKKHPCSFYFISNCFVI